MLSRLLSMIMNWWENRYGEKGETVRRDHSPRRIEPTITYGRPDPASAFGRLEPTAAMGRRHRA